LRKGLSSLDQEQ